MLPVTVKIPVVVPVNSLDAHYSHLVMSGHSDVGNYNSFLILYFYQHWLELEFTVLASLQS